MKNKKKQVQLREVQDVIDVIGGRWRGAILASLCAKEKRFNELKRDLGSITPRTLIKELKYLEMNKLVIREVSDSNVASVQYRLTDHGFSLEPLIASIVSWGQKHRKEVLGLVVFDKAI
jgi:DNA-binding HxlR family transcriptional regulator